MYYPKISIITVSLNSEKTIERTILSVINQNYKLKEYIIVDGNSSDSTLNIIKKYEKKIDIIISEKDKGISDAFNKGIEAATGEIIGIINSDDLLCNGALEQIAFNYEKQVGVYRGQIINWNEKTNYMSLENPDVKFNLFPIHARVCHQGTFVRRDIYMCYGGFDLKLHWIMDLDLLIRLYNDGVKFKRITKPLGCFTLNGITYTAYSPSRYKEWRYMLKKNGASKLMIELFILCKKFKVLFCSIIPRDFLLEIRDCKSEKYNYQQMIELKS